MVTKISWEEFRESKMLWWINMILHTFGLVIVTEVDDNGKVVDAYPARTKFRGFEADNNTAGYIGVSEYLKNNAEELYKEAIE